MQAQCPSCTSLFEVDPRRIPPSGAQMRCPKCGTSFVVKPTPSETHEIDLPAVKAPSPPNKPVPPPPPPVSSNLTSSGPMAAQHIDLPAPKRSAGRDDQTPVASVDPFELPETADLPAVKKEQHVDLPTPKGGGVLVLWICLP